MDGWMWNFPFQIDGVLLVLVLARSTRIYSLRGLWRGWSLHILTFLRLLSHHGFPGFKPYFVMSGPNPEGYSRHISRLHLTCQQSIQILMFLVV